MNLETVVLCYPVSDADLRKIELAFPNAKIVCSNQDRIGTDISEATVFCGHAKHRQIDWDSVVGNGKLRWIQSSAAGLDHCLAPAVIQSDIVVSGCSGLFANQVAEQAMALLLAMIRRMPEFSKAQSNRVFERRPTDTLHGKTIGIVGFGGNGRRIAALLKDIASSIMATDLFPDFECPDYVRLLPSKRQEELFHCSDVVIVTLPLTGQTARCIGSAEFSLMQSGSYFVNVARGAVVDQVALLEAIQSEKIAFAGLDVVDPEPPEPNDPIWEEKRILITPHVGAQSETRIPMTTELFCENIRRLRQGQILLNQVDKVLQFPRPEHRVRFDQNGKLLI